MPDSVPASLRVTGDYRSRWTGWRTLWSLVRVEQLAAQHRFAAPEEANSSAAADQRLGGERTEVGRTSSGSYNTHRLEEGSIPPLQWLGPSGLPLPGFQQACAGSMRQY